MAVSVAKRTHVGALAQIPPTVPARRLENPAGFHRSAPFAAHHHGLDDPGHPHGGTRQYLGH